MTPTLLVSRFYHEDLMNEMLFSWDFFEESRNGLTYELMLKRRHLCVILGLNLHVKYHDGRFCFVGCHENEHPQWGKQYFGFNYFKMSELLLACGLMNSSIVVFLCSSY